MLRTRIAFGQVITPETRVDPAAFPEGEFPVWCSGCRYLLRGLTEPRCPECGKSFDRGRLLVEQYVLARNVGFKRARKVAAWCLVLGGVGLCPLLVLLVAFALGPAIDPSKNVVDFCFRYGGVLLTMMYVPLGLTFVSTAIWIVIAFRLTRKGRQVARALDARRDTTP